MLDLGGKPLTISGNLNILGTLFMDNGTLTVSGNVSVMNGTIKMMDSNSRLIVKGNFTTDGKDETGLLTAGSLTVYGDFMQYGDFSRSSFCPSGTFAMTLIGTEQATSSSKLRTRSWLNDIPPTAVRYKSNSAISLKVDLQASAQNFASPYSYPHLCVQGALNGRTMTVPDGATVAGPLMMGGGRLFALGSLPWTARQHRHGERERLRGSGGNFTAGGHSDYQAGEVEVVGNFHQYSVVHRLALPRRLLRLPARAQDGARGREQDRRVSTRRARAISASWTLRRRRSRLRSTISLNCDLAAIRAGPTRTSTTAAI